MTFVDTNVFVYAVGRPHPLRDRAQSALRSHANDDLVTSAEVAQELLHVYLSAETARWRELDDSLRLVGDLAIVLPMEFEDVQLARNLAVAHPSLTARDLIHLAVCHRHDVTSLLTFDRALEAAFGGAAH